MNAEILTALLVAVFALQVCMGNANELSLQCKFHGTSSTYACVAIGLENYDEKVLINKVTGDHAGKKSHTSVDELIIRSQNVSFVPVNVWQFLPKLKRYEVKNSSLVAIIRQNFNNLELSTLVLSYNKIEALDKDVFHDLTQLKDLRLSGNQLTQIHYSTLDNNVNLQLLTLDNNKLSLIHEEQFRNLFNLREIRLNNNLIEDLRERTFVNNEKLEIIFLRNNMLKTVGSQLLVGLKFLKTFDFSNNQCIDKNNGTLEELSDDFHNFCFPPYLEGYKNQIEELKKTLAIVNETLSNCDTQLGIKTSTIIELKSQVGMLSEEKTSAESRLENCTGSKEASESALRTCQTEKEAKDNDFQELSESFRQCKLKVSNFTDTWKFINKTIAETTNDIDNCNTQMYTLMNSIKLSERSSQSKGDDTENDKMSLQIKNLTKQLETRDSQMKSFIEENDKLAKETSVRCEASPQPSAYELNECRLRQDEFQAQLQTCMTQLPMCNSFYIQCFFRHYSELNEYICSAEHVSACQPKMKLTVEGIHLATKSNKDVSVIEIKNSIFHFTQDLFVQLPNLRKIKVQNGGLSTLEPKLGSLNLISIELFDNFFSEVPSKIFQNVNKLESVELVNNGIEKLYHDSFFGLSYLTHLNLKDNIISTLPQGLFDGLTSLTQLSLERNRLTTLDGDLLRHNTMLRILKFDENRDLRLIGSRLLDYSKRFTMVQFKNTCTRTNNDDDVENVKLSFELYCSH